MSNVVGIPLIKGNSNVILGCEITGVGDAQTVLTEGMAVSLKAGSAKPVVDKLANGSFFGFIFDINPCNHQCSVVSQGHSITVPSADPAAVAAGDALKVNSLTGLVDAAGDIDVNGYIFESDASSAGNQIGTQGVNGKTGVAIPNCVKVSLGVGVGVVAPVVP